LTTDNLLWDIKAWQAWVVHPYTTLEWAIDTKLKNYQCCGKDVERHHEAFWCDICGRWADSITYTGNANPHDVYAEW